MRGVSPRRVLVAVVAVLVVAVLVIAATTLLRDGSDSDSAPAAAPVMNINTGQAGDVPRRPADDPLVLGRDDAPVTLVMFSDLNCEYCAYFDGEIQPELVERYVDAGKLRIEWRDAPTTGPASRRAARAARVAAEQDRFWEYTGAVYAAARAADKQPTLTEDELVSYAKEAGVPDLDRFRREAADTRADTEIDTEIDTDLRLAQKLFIPPSPAYWVDGTPLLSGLPLQAFVNAIDGKLTAGK